MHKRFWLICSVIGVALLVLSVLGLWSLRMYEKGVRAERQQEFVSVAEQIRFEVKKNLDQFIQTEQDRPYTDYLALYVPESTNQAAALVRSPLADEVSNGLAYGYFQLDSTGTITTPYYALGKKSKPDREIEKYLANLNDNLLPSLAKGESLQVRRIEPTGLREESEDKQIAFNLLSPRTARWSRVQPQEKPQEEAPVVENTIPVPDQQKGANPNLAKGARSRRDTYQISSFDEAQQTSRVQRQSRSVVDATFLENSASNSPGIINRSPANPDLNMSDDNQEIQQEQIKDINETEQKPKRPETAGVSSAPKTANEPVRQQVPELDYAADLKKRNRRVGVGSSGVPDLVPDQTDHEQALLGAQGLYATEHATQELQQELASGETSADRPDDRLPSDTVQIRIEPFVPMTVPDENGAHSLFAGQVFLMRHIQIENRHLLQGFRLDENELLRQVRQSARQLIRRGMGFNVSNQEQSDAAYTAVLDFGFGEMVLNLMELQPGFVQGRVDRLRNWCFAILAVVWLAVIIALATFWRNMYEQVQLSRKKDDFISAVSHELRTPLTSIRMYTEMLEKDWVKTDEKRREYYATMRQESERLSRLIENVLDFSRIQRGRKRYEFNVGDVNQSIADVMDMMSPYVERAGFTMESDFAAIEPFTFDRDAVVQIVINLLDNALKYAQQADDKHIIVRTRMQADYVVIEVEDRGPGIPRSQQKKIFEAFYRCGDESTRQAAGTGLGLALVKRFAEAHHGFVEIMNAKPCGALFRVGLANHFGQH